MGKKVDENKKELAYILFMQGTTNKEISARLEISEKTIGVWSETLGWKEKRSAKEISRPEIINRLLKKLVDMLDKGEINADEVSKISSAIEKIDREQGNLFMYINVFMEFGTWLNKLIGTEISAEDAKLIVRLQDRFIQEKL